jgi:hypothetical protein
MYKKYLLSLILILFILLSFAFLLGPYPFKISNQLQRHDQILSAKINIEDLDLIIPITILRNLTLERKPEMVWATTTIDRINETIKSGTGNCSNLTFGFASLLYKEKYPFDVIHILSPENFLFGIGHTVIEFPYEYENTTQIGIYDVLENGFPLNKEKNFSTLLDIKSKNFNEIDGYLYNPIIKKEKLSNYWNKKYLNLKGELGIMKGEEIERYFFITDNLFFSLGNNKYERYFFDGIALLFGYLPKVYISDETYDLFNKLDVVRFYLIASKFILLSIQLVLFSIFVLIAWYQISTLFHLLLKRKTSIQ